MSLRAFLTTIDNPYDPSVDFDSWYRYDCDKGYNSCGLLARFTNSSAGLSGPETALDIERAIDEIVKYDPLDQYVKIKREVSE